MPNDTNQPARDYSGMTTNERLFAAGLLDEFDHAIERQYRDSMVRLLKEVDLSQQAEAISKTILADRTLYGRAIGWSFNDANAFLARVTSRLSSAIMTANEQRKRNHSVFCELVGFNETKVYVSMPPRRRHIVRDRCTCQPS